MTIQRISDLAAAYAARFASGFATPTQQDDLVRSGFRKESLRKIYEALPDEVKDSSTKLWDRTIFVNKDVMISYSQKHLDSRPFMSVSFSGCSGITIRGKAWPLRKDGTFNDKAVIDFVLAVHRDCALRYWGATGIRKQVG
jgi:hypothetical protein